MKKTLIGITMKASFLLAACGNTDNEIVGNNGLRGYYKIWIL